MRLKSNCLSALLAILASTVATADESVYLYVLGIAQDAGYPQTGCYRPHCMPAWENPELRRLASSIAVVDEAEQTKFIFDATPDMPEQLYRLHRVASDSEYTLGGVFPTHGHIGHYTGLMHFGREAMGANGVPVYVMPRMKEFLSSNGPWDQLVKLGNIELRPLDAERPVRISERLTVTPLEVPHRDEYTETVGFLIRGPNRTAVYIPDIDKWGQWETDIRDVIRSVDYALLDATFFADGEIPGRAMEDIPHPFVAESMALFDSLTSAEKSRVHFIHINHTNPLLIDGSPEQTMVEESGFRVAREGLRLDL